MAEVEVAALLARIAKIKNEHPRWRELQHEAAQARPGEIDSSGGVAEGAPPPSEAVAPAEDEAGCARASEPGSILALLSSLRLEKYEGAISAHLADDLSDLKQAALDDLEDVSIGMSKDEAGRLLVALQEAS